MYLHPLPLSHYKLVYALIKCEIFKKKERKKGDSFNLLDWTQSSTS